MIDIKKAFLEIENGRLCYETIGRDKPFLILGGSLGGGAEYMYPVMLEISNRYKAILLHQRGTGDSIIGDISPSNMTLDCILDDIEKLRDHLSIEKFDVIGHSWGAMLSCAYLEKFPDFVSSLTLINSMGLSTAAFAFLIDNITQRHSGDDLDKLKYLVCQNQTSGDFDNSYRNFFKFAQTAYFFDKSLAQSFQKNLSPSFFSLPVYRFLLEDLVRKRFDLRKSFKGTEVKVSMIWGRQDIMGAQPIVELNRAFPNMDSRVIERCGHYPWFEKSKIFSKILLDMISD